VVALVEAASCYLFERDRSKRQREKGEKEGENVEDMRIACCGRGLAW